MIKHKKIDNKICIKCYKNIDIKKDYIRLIEYIKGKENRDEYYHIKCYDELFNMKKMAFTMVNKVNKLMELAGLPKEEEVVRVGKWKQIQY